MQINEIKKYLQKLGIGSEAATIYLDLVEHGESTPLLIARRTGINRTKVYRLVEDMQQRRLVREIRDEYRTKIEAESGERLQTILFERQAETRALTNKWGEVLGAVNQLTAKEPTGTKVRYYRGREGIGQMVWNTLKASSEIVGYTYSSFESAVGEKFVEEYYAEFYRRNLRMRDILSNNYLRSMREESQKPKTYRQHPHWRTHINSRYMSEKELPIPHQMDIYDETVGIYSWYGGEIFGVEIVNPKVAEFQRTLFERTWAQAKVTQEHQTGQYDNKQQTEMAFLLSRTTIGLPEWSTFLPKVERVYPAIGHIKNAKPLVFGYEDANFWLKTTKGEYVLKVFAADMARTYVEAHGKTIALCNKLGIPSPRLITAKGEKKIAEVEGQLVMVTQMFKGDNFTKKVVTGRDQLVITRALAKLNQQQKHWEVGYDSWGNANLMRELKRDQDRASQEVKDKIKSVVDRLRQLDTAEFCHGLIHGDIQPNHVLKNERGEYCILDFGVARYDAVVYELSTHLAWFCLSEKSWKNYAVILKRVITEYTKLIRLRQAEIDVIPVLIAASYASYYLRTSILIAEGDASRETREWNRGAGRLLELALDKI